MFCKFGLEVEERFWVTEVRWERVPELGSRASSWMDQKPDRLLKDPSEPVGVFFLKELFCFDIWPFNDQRSFNSNRSQLWYKVSQLSLLLLSNSSHQLIHKIHWLMWETGCWHWPLPGPLKSVFWHPAPTGNLVRLHLVSVAPGVATNSGSDGWHSSSLHSRVSLVWTLSFMIHDNNHGAKRTSSTHRFIFKGFA